MGATFGAIEVAVPATAVAAGTPGATGLLLAVPALAWLRRRTLRLDPRPELT